MRDLKDGGDTSADSDDIRHNYPGHLHASLRPDLNAAFAGGSTKVDRILAMEEETKRDPTLIAAQRRRTRNAVSAYGRTPVWDRDYAISHRFQSTMKN